MLHVVSTGDISVGDVLAEGLVLNVEKSADSDIIILSVPTGQIRARRHTKTFRITRLDRAQVNRFVKAMRM
jgi:hypothetical protein